MERNRLPLGRRSLRLQDFGYAQPGGYFVTYRRETLFGEIQERSMRLNRYGEIAGECFKAIARHFDNVAVDEFVIMPNHIHGIVVIINVGARHAVPVQSLGRFGKPMANSLPTIVRSFKSATTKRINDLRQTSGAPVWQRNYYEHVIRNEPSLHRIREYIGNNPARWDFDRENPAATIPEPKNVWRQ